MRVQPSARDADDAGDERLDVEGTSVLASGSDSDHPNLVDRRRPRRQEENTISRCVRVAARALVNKRASIDVGMC